MIASLLLGVPTEGGPALRRAGRRGRDQRRQVARLRTLRRADPPFADQVPAAAARHAIWVQPRLVGLVEFTGWGPAAGCGCRSGAGWPTGPVWT